MSRLAINEIFGPTIQGEGTLVGEPSIFIRTNACNLRCCFRGSICDTPYTSHAPEANAYNTVEDAMDVVNELLFKYPKVDNVVITGGEPMLQQTGLKDLLWWLSDANKLKVTIETNGTISIDRTDTEWGELVDLWSVSPKLSDSEHFEETTVPEPLRAAHKRTRINYDAIISYVLTGSLGQLKFVYSGPEAEQEIKEWLQGLEDYAQNTLEHKDHIKFSSMIKMWRVMIMPEGTTQEQIAAKAQEAIEVCIRNGWTFCDRLHIRIWGDKRAV